MVGRAPRYGMTCCCKVLPILTVTSAPFSSPLQTAILPLIMKASAANSFFLSTAARTSGGSFSARRSRMRWAGGVVGHMGYRMFTSEKIFAQWQFGRVADYLLPPVQSFPTGRGEDLLWEWLSLYIHLSARCVCKWVCPVWGLCRCTAGVAPPLPNFPNPKQNSDAFCLGTRPLRTSPCKGGAFWTNTRLSFLFHHITG